MKEQKINDLIGRTVWTSDSALGTLETVYLDDKEGLVLILKKKSSEST